MVNYTRVCERYDDFIKAVAHDIDIMINQCKLDHKLIKKNMKKYTEKHEYEYSKYHTQTNKIIN